MNNKELEKRKRAIWEKSEKKYPVKMDPDMRRYIENEFDWHDPITDLKDLEDSLPFYMGLLVRHANSLNAKAQDQSKKHIDSDKKRVYRRTLEKRLYLVEFVNERVLTFHNLIARSFTPHKRIPWKKLAEIWNKRHPHDIWTPNRLRMEYYRIIRDDVVRREYFDRLDKKFAEFATEGMQKEAIIFADAICRAMGKDFDKFHIGEPQEITKIIKNIGEYQIAPHSWELANFESMLLHKAVEAAKAKERKGD